MGEKVCHKDTLWWSSRLENSEALSRRIFPDGKIIRGQAITVRAILSQKTIRQEEQKLYELFLLG